MRVAIVGAGGVGGYVGMHLAEAGHDVSWVVRGRTLEAMRSDGIGIERVSGNLKLGPQKASADPADLGVQDAVIVTVKMYDLEGLAPRLRPLVGPDTAVLPLQNGIDANPILSRALDPGNVMQGTISIKSFLVGTARLKATSPKGRIKMADGDNGISARAKALAEALNESAGIEAMLSDDMPRDLWYKFILLAGFAGVCCLNRANLGQISRSPEARALVVDAVGEAASVGRKLGVNVPEDIQVLIDRQFVDSPRDSRPSMLEDIDAGNRLELPWLSGAVVRVGREIGVPTPLNLTIYRALAMHINGRAQ